jgi:conjugative transfer signal peptidase TraF
MSMRWSPLVILLGSATLLSAAWPGLERVPDVVLYNGTTSMPVGFYLRSDNEMELGAIVTVNAYALAPDYMAARGAGSDFRLLKRIAATDGAIVCADGDEIRIDNAVRALRSARDGNGALLPSWSGCHSLRDGEYFVLGDSAESFDSRYFGAVTAADIEGVWRPLFQTE